MDIDGWVEPEIGWENNVHLINSVNIPLITKGKRLLRSAKIMHFNLNENLRIQNDLELFSL